MPMQNAREHVIPSGVLEARNSSASDVFYAMNLLFK
jgi:hypothetical protein